MAGERGFEVEVEVAIDVPPKEPTMMIGDDVVMPVLETSQYQTRTTTEEEMIGCVTMSSEEANVEGEGGA